MEHFSDPIVWQDSWSVGNDLLDEQHKNLISYINRLIELNNALAEDESNHQTSEMISDVFRELIDYTETHFRDEEKLLEKYNYRNLHAHKEIHTNFCSQLVMLKDKFDQHGVNVLPTLTKFLGEWLKRHILVTDKKYSSIVGQRDVP